MKTIISIILAVVFLTACTYPPKIWIPVDNRKVPFLKVEQDHADCLEAARIAFPCTNSQLRSPMRGVSRIARLNYLHQRAYVIDCLTKKGYRVLKTGEVEPF